MRIDIVQVVGCYHWNVQVFVHLVEKLIKLSLRRRLPIVENAVVFLNFEIEILWSEDILVPAGHLISFFLLLFQQLFGNLAGETGRGNNQPLGIFR